MKKISILGSTGSIGRSTLEIVEKSSFSFDVVGLAAGRNLELLEQQMVKFKPKEVSCAAAEDAERLRQNGLGADCEINSGPEGAVRIAQLPDSDIVVSAITGINGLEPTIAALAAGKAVALANKESMVVGGCLIRKMIEGSEASMIPVDSEHSGVFQCMSGVERKDIRRVTLTASGGPFFLTPKENMGNVSLDAALDHPRWKMGKKVTIDSATLMNKGLELIEAKWLFDLEPEKLEMIVHPQSIVHSLVEMQDGSVLAQLSQTDMKIPIQYALTYPERADNLLPPLDLSGIGSLEFFEVDLDKFPLARLAQKVLRLDDSFSVVLNAANEVAVEAFLNEDLEFSGITNAVTEAVESHEGRAIGELREIFDLDRETRLSVRNFIEKGK
ncbi:1-deoxy-D-xylulose-5-phosphate reductoisomerase [Acidobacteriota bacterium]